VVTAAIFLWTLVDPISFAFTFGARGVMLLGASFWIILITAGRCIVRTHFWFSLPAVALVILSLSIDSHRLRCVDCDNIDYPLGEFARNARQKLTALDAAQSSKRTRSEEVDNSVQHEIFPDFRKVYTEFTSREGDTSPLIVISTAGGGLRAAYWTVTVLGALEDLIPGFSDHIFAISGVSGGSVGAAVFRALIERQRRSLPLECRSEKGRKVTGCGACGQAILENDFLSPLLTGLLFRDALPLPIADRAALLELAWERAWRQTLDRGPGLDQRFDNIATGMRAPILIFNGASLLGGRVATSALAVDDRLLNPAAIRPMALSTAANTSARFPLFEPAGSVVDRYGTYYGSVVDGGYVENFGADSALDIVRQLAFFIQDDSRLPLGPSTWTRKIFIIQISSDPELSVSDDILVDEGLRIVNLDTTADALPKPVTNLDQLTAPLRVLLGARGTQGVFTARQLIQAARRVGGNFYHFRLLDRQRHQPPLNWSLSTTSFEQIKASLDDNKISFDYLVRAFQKSRDAWSP
jgi:hypothetical protein